MEKRVLIVDDDADSRDICVTLLRHYHYDVLEASNGEEAVSLVGEQHPDLVLMDAMLPVLDGWAATERLKSAPETADIPVVMVTACAHGFEQERGRTCGVDSYLTKPCEPMRVLEEVQRFIGPAV